MTRHILILVVFFSFLGVVLAQEKIITVQVIINDEQEEHPGSVYITNSRNSLSVITDSWGKALMAVLPGDFLFLSSDFYYNQSFIVTEEIIRKEKAEIVLKPKIILLEEADLGFRLTGNLAKDAKNARYKDSATMAYQNLGIQEKDVPKPNPFGQKAGSGMIAENLIGSITGYNKRQKKNLAYDKRQKKLDEIKNYFAPDYFENELKIPVHKINEFLSFVEGTSEIYRKIKVNDFISAERIMKEKSIVYLERLTQIDK